MKSRTLPFCAVGLTLALIITSCGMRGGSQQTIIDGLGGSNTLQPAGRSPNSGVPAGETLTSSAPGITPTEIHIGTIQDISGPVPGLFQTAQDGVKAWVAYENSIGGIDGRKLVLDTYDAGLNPTKFSQEMQQACTSDFALVGVMSTVDNAGALEGQQCQIPDVADNPTTPQAAAATNVFAADPSMPNEYPNGWFKWVKANYPSVIDHAAIMWPDVSTTQLTGERLMYTAESVGFKFVYKDATPPIEANFLPYVESMKSAGVQYFAWQADYQSMARILQAMQQLNWRPKVIDSSATVYNQEFLNTAGSAANGIFISLNVALFGEANSNPAMKTFLTWLNKAVPGHAPPDIFSIYSWAAGMLFAQAMQQAGANPTRAQVINALSSIHNFSANGMLAPTDPGGHKASACFEVVTVKNDKFVRYYPTTPNTFDCTTGSLYTDPQIPPASISG